MRAAAEYKGLLAQLRSRKAQIEQLHAKLQARHVETREQFEGWYALALRAERAHVERRTAT
jgi:hypothetical protein